MIKRETKKTIDNCEIILENHRRYYVDGKPLRFWTWFGKVYYIRVVSNEIGVRAEYSFPYVRDRILFSEREIREAYDGITNFQDARIWDSLLRKRAKERV